MPAPLIDAEIGSGHSLAALQKATVAASPNATPPRFWVRLLPSITDVASLLPLYFVFVKQGGAPALLQDAGTALHILTGNWILAHHAVPHRDLFSFTKPESPWCAWEWGWDVLAALIHQRFGLSGIVLAHCLILALLFALLFRLIRRRSGNSLIAFALTVLAVQTSCFHWLARPHLLSWLFVVVLLHLLDWSAGGSPRALWFIPPLVLLWANLHGSFFIALILLAASVAGELLLAAVVPGAQGPRAHFFAARRYTAAAFASLAASLCNPYGWRLHAHIVEYLLDSRQLERIKEFQSTDFHHSPALAIELLLLLGVLAALWSIAARRWAEAIAILIWAHFALVSMRNVPLFAFIAAGAIGAMLTGAGAAAARLPVRPWLPRLARGILEFGGDIEEMERITRVPWLAALALVFIALLLRAPVKPTGFAPAVTADFDARIFPVRAVAEISAAGPVGRVFTSDQWGDYLLYRAYPNVRVFLDDRSDFYGADFDGAAIRIATAQYDWRELLAKYRVDTALLSPKDPLAAVLRLSPEWRPVFSDSVALVFRRTQVSSEYLTAENPMGGRVKDFKN